jgi:DNA-binding NarL/FixJ family response regulator
MIQARTDSSGALRSIGEIDDTGAKNSGASFSFESSRQIPTRKLIVIDEPSLHRECLVECLRSRCEEFIVSGFETPEEWLGIGEQLDETSLIFLHIGSISPAENECRETISRLVEAARPAPVIVIGHADGLQAIMSAIECGALGYVPSSVGFSHVVEATRVTASSGVYLPRRCLMSLRSVAGDKPASSGDKSLEADFTERQLAVARALQQGAANKSIAYQLNLCESTVKVHVRNIMKKLHATNRTQAAYKLNALLPAEKLTSNG